MRSWSLSRGGRAATKSEVSSFAEVTPSLTDAGARALPRLARACWAAWAVIALELSVALAFAAREIAGSWEVEYGLVWLAPTALFVGGAVAVIGAGLAWLIERSDASAVRGLLCALCVAAGSLVGVGVGGGRHLATLANRGGFAVLVGALCGVLCFWTAPRLNRLLCAWPMAGAVSVALLVLLAEVLNR